MARIFAIFSLFLVLGVWFPTDGWGAANCQPVQCECKNENYEWIDEADKQRGCKLTDAAQNNVLNMDTARTACLQWYDAEWDEDSDPLDPNTWKCKCPDKPGVIQSSQRSCSCAAGYKSERNSSNEFICVARDCTTLRAACDTLGTVAEYKSWRGVNGEICECKCRDSGKVFDINGGSGGAPACIDKPTVDCSAIDGTKLAVGGCTMGNVYV